MKHFYSIFFLILLLFNIIFLKDALKDYHIKSENNIVEVIIISVPDYCLGSSSNIDVSLNSKIYTAHISKRSCAKDKYSVNQKIKIYYSDKYEDVVMLFAPTKFIYNMALGSFLVTLFMLLLSLFRFKLNWNRLRFTRKSFHFNKTDKEVSKEINELKKRLLDK